MPFINLNANFKFKCSATQLNSCSTMTVHFSANRVHVLCSSRLRLMLSISPETHGIRSRTRCQFKFSVMLSCYTCEEGFISFVFFELGLCFRDAVSDKLVLISILILLNVQTHFVFSLIADGFTFSLYSDKRQFIYLYFAMTCSFYFFFLYNFFYTEQILIF